MKSRLTYCRFLAFFSDSYRTEESDDVHAALALMYGYAARYAPSMVIEARIDALVVRNLIFWAPYKFLNSFFFE